jgi:hypothetical protein
MACVRSISRRRLLPKPWPTGTQILLAAVQRTAPTNAGFLRILQGVFSSQIT